jgi:hypothetical protein
MDGGWAPEGDFDFGEMISVGTSLGDVPTMIPSGNGGDIRMGFRLGMGGISQRDIPTGGNDEIHRCLIQKNATFETYAQ